MKSFDTQLQKYAEKTRLKAAERRELRERVLTYMEYHPLPKQSDARSRVQHGGRSTERIVSEPFRLVRINTFYTRIAAGIFGIFFIVAIPFAAERSVPGDTLYPVKTLSEGIRAQFASSPYEQVAFETELIERRISEARLLAREGKLTEAVEAEIAKTVQEHASAAQKQIDELKTSDADEGAIAEIAYGSALDVQSAVLDSDAAKGNASTTDGIASAVREAKRQSLEKQSSEPLSYDKLMARVEQETTRAYELYESIKDSATDGERADIERRLDDIDRSITGAQNLNGIDQQDAIAALKNALSLTNKLISFMTDIDVRESVPLDMLVPVVQTQEELQTDVATRIERVRREYTALAPELATIEDANVVEKVVAGMDLASTSLNAAEKAFDGGDYEAADEAISRSANYLNDVLRLRETFGTSLDSSTASPQNDTSGETGTGTSTPTGDVSGSATSTDSGDEEAPDTESNGEATTTATTTEQ